MSDPASPEPGDIYRMTSGPQAGQPDVAAAVSTLRCAEELLQGVGKPLTAGMVSSARRTLVAALEAAQQPLSTAQPLMGAAGSFFTDLDDIRRRLSALEVARPVGTSGYYEEVTATQELPSKPAPFAGWPVPNQTAVKAAHAALMRGGIPADQTPTEFVIRTYLRESGPNDATERARLREALEKVTSEFDAIGTLHAAMSPDDARRISTVVKVVQEALRHDPS